MSANKKEPIRIGLAGNPNSGKTTIFNALTGSRQRVANYSGVTVEKKESTLIYKDRELIIYDLPGTYSLTAYSIDEVVARDFILDEKPHVIIDVLDSTNIERNLYLCLQFQELGIPVIGALNISDQAEEMGIVIQEDKLSQILGIPMIKTVGAKKIGLDNLLDKVLELENQGFKKSQRSLFYGLELETEVEKITHILNQDKEFINTYPTRWMAIKLLEKDKHAKDKLESFQIKEKVLAQVKKSIKTIEEHFGSDAEIVVSEQRYAYVHGAAMEGVRRSAKVGTKATEAIDKVLLNRVLGLPIFLLILWGIFQITFTIGEYPIDWLESFFTWLGRGLSGILPDGIVKSLVVDGIIAGVGGVLEFVPLVVILFFLISFLEDVGYMSRAAFIMDKFLHIFGLHGQSFLPMMLGFGCSIPAIMAARTLKNPKDRILTILVTPFMSCGAKLPVYVLLAGAFFKAKAGTVVLSIYIIGVFLALLSSILLKKTLIKGEATPFVMELPPYRLPTAKGILWHVWDKTVHYFQKAGTVILLASILIWGATHFPKTKPDLEKYQAREKNYQEDIKNKERVEKEINIWLHQKTVLEDKEEQKQIKEKKNHFLKNPNLIEKEVEKRLLKEAKAYNKTLIAQESLENSFAGSLGKVMEPILKPIGFDWKIGIATITGIAAKEIVVSTLGVLYSTGVEEDEESVSLRQALKQDPHFNPLIAYSLMLFILIMAPCLATLAVIRSEIGWKWLGFHIFYTIILAWLVSFGVFQIGSFILS